MRQLFFATLFLFFVSAGQAQKNNAYLDSMKAFQKNYVEMHGILQTKEQQSLIRFFPIDASYRVDCTFEKINNSPWLPMATSGAKQRMHRQYGKITFRLHDSTLHLFLYQSQDLMQTEEEKNYLFLLFSDATSGEESYGAGRYIDCTLEDIHGSHFVLDFNKAYNPYCAYTVGYNCPIPPKENDLPVAIRAGEKNYGGKVSHEPLKPRG